VSVNDGSDLARYPLCVESVSRSTKLFGLVHLIPSLVGDQLRDEFATW